MSVSERALDLLQWVADVERDPLRRMCMVSGTHLYAQALADGAVESIAEFGALIEELRAAGYMTWRVERRDQ